MRIGLFRFARSVDGLVDDTRRAEADGFDALWVAHGYTIDALTGLAVAGREVPRIALCTGVVPSYPRHPASLAHTALTVHAATGGRLVLGVGTSHRHVIEGSYALPFEAPARHLQAYLEVLAPLLRTGRIDHDPAGPGAYGAHLAYETGAPAGVGPVPLILAALGPRMLRLAGAVADGTLTWMTGLRTIGSHVVPTMRAAADAAGRDTPPRCILGIPVCVTDDRAGAYARASRQLAGYRDVPSYRAMLDREGLAEPADLAVIGSEGEVADRLLAFAAAGADEVAALVFGDADEAERTRRLLVSLR